MTYIESKLVNFVRSSPLQPTRILLRFRNVTEQLHCWLGGRAGGSNKIDDCFLSSFSPFLLLSKRSGLLMKSEQFIYCVNCHFTTTPASDVQMLRPVPMKIWDFVLFGDINARQFDNVSDPGASFDLDLAFIEAPNFHTWTRSSSDHHQVHLGYSIGEAIPATERGANSWNGWQSALDLPYWRFWYRLATIIGQHCGSMKWFNPYKRHMFLISLPKLSNPHQMLALIRDLSMHQRRFLSMYDKM